jgi:ribosomal protein L27
MARIYKSARGKTIDMDKVKLSQETTTAVGNMKVNARGDQLGAGGQVAQGRNAIMDQMYAVKSGVSTVDRSNRRQQTQVQQPAPVADPAPVQAPVQEPVQEEPAQEEAVVPDPAPAANVVPVTTTTAPVANVAPAKANVQPTLSSTLTPPTKKSS